MCIRDRAKRLLAKKQVPFEVPRKSQLDERLDSVLEVIYLCLLYTSRCV